MGLKIWQWGTVQIMSIKKIGDEADDAGGAEGLLMGLNLLVMGLEPQQPLPWIRA